jgi:Matrixin
MRRAQLNVQGLERRDVPATFGIPWANGTSVTVSFAPDGTDVDGTPNELSALMARSGLSTAVWQREIFEALQAWVAAADINVGFVGDNGAPLGASGLEQANSRFGDIRIFAVPLSSSVLAITTPPGDLGGTRLGDIILNSNYNFGVGNAAQRDLYTVFLQESGHALGVGNSLNTTSVMYEFYQGARTGLSAEDIGLISSLYGSRPTDTWEPAGGNGSAATAVNLAGPDTRVTYGDMASAADADWYSFTAPRDGSVRIDLQVGGLSLLAGRLTVFNSAVTSIGMSLGNGAGQDQSLDLVGLAPGAKYYLRVDEATGTWFAAGQYRLRIAADSGAPEIVILAGQPPVDDSGTNESFLSATRLTNISTDGGTEYQTFARIRTSSDVDVYRIRTPIAGMNQANVLTATVRAFGDLAPKIAVTNSLGLPVPSRLIANGNGLYTVVVANATANADYQVAVSSQNGATGDYELRVGVRSQISSAHQVESGILTILNKKKTGSLEITGSAQIYFRLTAAFTPIIGPSITLRVYDSLNRVKFTLLAKAGDKVDGVALLGPGKYRVEIAANGSLLPSVLSAYSLETALLTDPVAVPPSDPNKGGGSGTSTPPPSGYNYYNDRGYYVYGETTPTGGG